jgi:hypothetical protein
MVHMKKTPMAPKYLCLNVLCQNAGCQNRPKPQFIVVLIEGTCKMRTLLNKTQYTDIKYFRRILLVSKTFPQFPTLGVQNCLKLAI